MNVVKTQDLNITIPIHRIIRTTVEKKAENCWLITATVENDRAVTLARYSNEKDAIAADTNMWLCEDPIYYFPVCPRNPDGESSDS